MLCVFFFEKKNKEIEKWCLIEKHITFTLNFFFLKKNQTFFSGTYFNNKKKRTRKKK